MSVDSQAKLFGQRLRQLRLTKKLKQHQLGRMIGGKGDQYISDLERGRGRPPFEVLCALAEALDVPMFELFSFQGIEDDSKSLKKKIETWMQGSDTEEVRKLYRLMLVAFEKRSKHS